MADLALDVHGRRLESDLRAVVLAELGDEFAVMGLDAVEALEKVDVKIGAPELAVGDSPEADVLLRPHDLANAIVLDRAQRLGGQRLGEKLLARLFQPAGAKKTADVVGAKRRLRHAILPVGGARRRRAQV